MLHFIRRHFGLLFVVVFAAIAAVYLLQPKAPPTAKLVTATRSDIIRVLTLNGRVRAFDVADIKPRRAGTLVEVVAEEGSAVKKGDVLARVQNAQEQAAVTASQKTAAARKLELAQAQRDLKRVEQLKREGYATTERLEQARLAVATAQADIARLNASTAQLKAGLDDTVLTAPFDGVVQRKLVDQGTSVGLDTVVFTLAANGANDVEAEADEIYAPQLAEGQKVSITTPNTSQPLEGTITWKAPNIDTKTGGVLLRIESDAVSTLPPGLSVGLTIEVERVENALTLPREAILAPQSAPAVLKLNPATNILVKTPIEIVDWPAATVEVKNGLSETDKITLAPRSFEDGQKITPAVSTGEKF